MNAQACQSSHALVAGPVHGLSQSCRQRDRRPQSKRAGFLLLAAGLLLTGCATSTIKPEVCPAGTQQLVDCPPVAAVQDAAVEELRGLRTFGIEGLPTDFDAVEIARTADIPIKGAYAKFIGSNDDASVTSIAAKLWMIENAEHTVDVMYYIFRDDLVGQALLGALCNAVQRGVDVRIMIDSIGSSDLNRKNLKALASCAIEGGFMRNEEGQLTIHKARVQAAIFNAATTSFANPNRRSHDKLIVKDGRFHSKSYAITGGRNVSLDYYGFLEDGSPNPHSYRDADILVHGSLEDSDKGIGDVTAIYYTLLFQFEKNKLLSMTSWSDPESAYARHRAKFRESLAALKALPKVQTKLEGIDAFMTSGFHETQLRLAHNLANVTNKNVVTRAVENLSESPNSIVGIINRVWDGHSSKHVRIVSPYLFAAKYKDKDGNVVVDEAAKILAWLDENPDSKITIVTNSVLTSDNFFTQSVIDLDLVPRLLMTPQMQEQWGKSLKNETDPEFVGSEAWVRMVNHPRLFIYETGTLDDERFGGHYHHSKLHAKYIVGDDIGFVGTTNFDYRSRLYNNEMGFFFDDPALIADIAANTDYLVSLSYRWGSPEWLEMRQRIREWKGTKASTVRTQRGIYKTIKNTGLMWLF